MLNGYKIKTKPINGTMYILIFPRIPSENCMQQRGAAIFKLAMAMDYTILEMIFVVSMFLYLQLSSGFEFEQKYTQQ